MNNKTTTTKPASQVSKINPQENPILKITKGIMGNLSHPTSLEGTTSSTSIVRSRVSLKMCVVKLTMRINAFLRGIMRRLEM